MEKSTRVVCRFLLSSLKGIELIYLSVLRQFQESWRHSQGEKNSYKRIVRIIGIRPPRHIQSRYREYRYVRTTSLKMQRFKLLVAGRPWSAEESLAGAT